MSESRVVALREAAPNTGGTFSSTLLVLCLTAAIGWVLIQQAGWPAHHVGLGLLGFGALGGFVNIAWAWHMGGSRFGEANQATLVRSGLVCLIGSALLASGQISLLSWHLSGLIGLALGLDALDGYLARRFRLGSTFGARFDMEIDALLILILSLLVWQSGRVGAWVLAIGLMRYAFVLISLVWPALQGPLPSSLRRKSVCALQGIALLACLLPPLGAGLAASIAALSLTALAVSFGIDIAALGRRSAASQPCTESHGP